VITRIIDRLSIYRAISIGLLISLVGVAHIPSRIQPGIFDRNAAPQFVALVTVGLISLLFVLTSKTFLIPRAISIAVLSLLTFATASLFLSDSFMTSFLGDTGRYSGYISLVSFLLIACAASTVTSDEFHELLLGIATGIILVTILGLLQEESLINLPTGAGVGSTLGNLDFLSAWVGTTILLVYLAMREYRKGRIFFAVYAVGALYLLWQVNAKQGLMDLALIALILVLYKISRYFDFSAISKRAWKIIFSFVFLIWNEIIYLVPMLDLPIPGIGDDPQVSIRANFWFSGMNMFAHHIGFGVGPDNYGNYYEKFRSLDSVKATEFVLANDAHSSIVQTFATLGIFSTIAFFTAILLFAFATIDLYFHTRNRRYLIILTSFFVFYTNAAISPITLPHKAIFWALAGYVVGEVARLKLLPVISISRAKVSTLSVVFATVLALALTLFLPPALALNQAIAKNQVGQPYRYTASGVLPCSIYASAQIQLVAKSGGDVDAAALTILRNHPRCLDVLSFMAEKLIHEKKYLQARPFILQMLDVAPARQSVVRIAAVYAMKTNDQELKNLLTSQGVKLGLLKETI
jgi:hypothetical protein